MREIKFRAWDKASKNLWPGKSMIDLFYQCDGGYFYGNLGWGDLESSDIILMQYAGLVDKNGKEIYEGDIVKDGNNILTEIKWEEFEHNEGGYFSGFFLNDDSPRVIEVIGNIYENPELLDVK